ncbi:formiminotetrahydrofolate cyclodeaminase [Sedimentibacter acidaminivorans]|uniref:Formiminotetrahydrofolate cyclodeaminase n=1 Tax=Sedimentibacter acidaminivorans TaxID=913099 RepID=A0ABS4GAK1_9FIRM|nr:cyclodeaminase/cyclohydrolase family protein [Sedimentibacter acidaminivorans]MBP1924708.1 formiminotetrahydrofolate cyclodeaminase [Sedimentibacter acidaminivorans]
MELTQLSCKEFAFELASKKPVPGGGGAAALVGALGAALNTMVANFSVGKKKFVDYKEKHEDIIRRGEMLRNKLIYLIDKDAENFEPLSKAYSMSSSTEEEKIKKEETLQKCLKIACSAPLEILQYTYEAILLHNEIVDISSKTIISDVGVGVQCLKAALYSAYLNVEINIKSMNDDEYVLKTREKSKKMVEDGAKLADEVFEKVVIIMNE